MESTCKRCKEIFLIQKGLINFCSIKCKATYSSEFNDDKTNNIKAGFSLNQSICSKIFISNCSCGQLFVKQSKSIKKCHKCVPNKKYIQKTNIFIKKCGKEDCNNLTVNRYSQRNNYCMCCAKAFIIKKQARIECVCLVCDKPFKKIPSDKNKSYCSKKCFIIASKENGFYRKIGNISAKKQQRKSKNEILFKDLITEKFPLLTILSGHRLIDTWDCDIYIKELNLAILWDGQWHRIQISKQQSLKQVQNRDRIKRKLFLANGINIITVNDFGRYNEKFVHQKLEELIDIIKGITTKEQFNHII